LALPDGAGYFKRDATPDRGSKLLRRESGFEDSSSLQARAAIS
jgi:hypothetical protein